ncbi:MAG: PQQ-binding-like beta-propeller repeat protein [Verrucomicrobia bacterium]|nr:PQQ-binding-like beta-propeller repeat protein [Verrucomicrobiota bacterium]
MARFPRIESFFGSRLARNIAFVAGAFCCALALVMLYEVFSAGTKEFVDAKKITALKQKLNENPLDEELKAEIRVVDLERRRVFLRRNELLNSGAWLLLLGAALFYTGAKLYNYKTKIRPPRGRGLKAEAQLMAAVTDQRALAVLGAVAVAGGVIALLISDTNIEQRTIAKAGGAVDEGAGTSASDTNGVQDVADMAPYPSHDEMMQNWPRFRGPGGNGVSQYLNVPTNWNAATGEGIVWKTEVPITGPSSPIVWGDSIFLASATETVEEIYCFDASDGGLVWRRQLKNVPNEPEEPPQVMEDSGGYAPSTPATDGRRVYAIFANGNLGAFDYEGKQVWVKNLGLPDNGYGHASSLLTYKDKLIVQYDQGTPDDEKSRIYAFDTATGEMVWQTDPRPVPASWATPIVIRPETAPEQIITCADPWVISYAPDDGEEIWRARALYGEVTPSPIFASGLVFTAMEGEFLSAIEPDGTNDVTDTKIVWEGEDGLPNIASPVSDGKRVYLINTYGPMTCYDIDDGELLWEKYIEFGPDEIAEFNSSPTVAGEMVYVTSTGGTTIIVPGGDEYKEVNRCSLGERVLSSPAFMDGRIYIRGETNLFCLGSGE